MAPFFTMITKQSIKAIHAAKNRAGLTDGEYRAILLDVADCHTCKLMDQGDVGKVLDAIQARVTKRRGWQPAQTAKVRGYAELARMSDQEMRQLLHEVSGQMHEDSPSLNNYHYDRMMIRLEMRVADAVARGDSKWPDHYRPTYWRTRGGKPGDMTTRERHEIFKRWDQLKKFLPPEKRNDGYLQAIAIHATGRRIAEIYALKSWQALQVIDALGDRLTYAIRNSKAKTANG